MNLAAISLLALAIAVTLSCTTKINVGILSMALAWIIGVYLAGRPFSEIAAGFPTGLFLTLVGVTLLFTQAKVNGTLDKIAHRAVQSCGGSLTLSPGMFFFLAFVFGSIGPGSVASAALIGPMAMTVAAQIGIPAFPMAIMVANGANSASLSPIGPTGIIVNSIFEKMGMPAVPWWNYFIVFVAHAIVAFIGYGVCSADGESSRRPGPALMHAGRVLAERAGRPLKCKTRPTARCPTATCTTPCAHFNGGTGSRLA